ncbi:hypothetical protein [Modestobacter sp. VKM Ac-2984]|uniref:hypothetical protein n=1 Tax=Modestobacter sp. VKM Ac-2984 TaxID=3004138 RepID=UPI0022AB18F9|nr:hypothetical protein [Modestobacter sp. VKM Ac-2984]MCZ2817918.1 hypothetical protein [Modestobacter sp. VKM Ac-2984]
MLIRQNGGTWQSPTVTNYTDEAALETLLLESPDLLPGADGSPLAVVSQLYVPQTGPVDLFAISLSGELTVVECKLKANPEIRRSVVGQVLAYAAGLWRLSYEELDAAFAARAGKPMIEVLAARADSQGGEFSAETFRSEVSRNLATGSMRLVIAVDAITEELKRVVEFLNDRTVVALDVLALELGYVRHGEMEILAPTVYGQEAVRRKAAEGPRSRWDEQSLLAAIHEHSTPEAAATLVTIYQHGQQHPRWTNFYWGEGKYPSVVAWFDVGDQNVAVWGIYTGPQGRTVLAVNFEWMFRKGIGVPAAQLDVLADRLRTLSGVEPLLSDLVDKRYARRPSIPEAALQSPAAAGVITGALDELFAER